MSMEPPERLRAARRALEYLPFCSIVDDLTLICDRWTLRLVITVDSCASIPRLSEWFVVLPRNYPFGEISIFPSKSQGITETYPHQAYNWSRNEYTPWLDGKPCVSSCLRKFGRRVYDVEPMAIENRLAWHIRRLKEWIEAADKDTLLQQGDPYELPEYPNTLQTENLGFFGSVGTIGKLEEESWGQYGGVTLQRINGDDKTHIWIPIKFEDVNQHQLSTLPHIIVHEYATKNIFGIWLRVSNVPYIAPWRGIRTFGELREFLKSEGIDFDTMLQRFESRLRDGKQHVLLLGFPIPERVGSNHGSWHWLAMLLPVLAHGHIRGFRNSRKAYLLHDKTTVLSDQSEIQWIRSNSWRTNDILCRGCFDQTFATKKVLVIGLGAIGAFVSELLVRAGIKNLLLIDNDRVEIGNLTRHTLTIKDIGGYKVYAIRRRLQIIEPCVSVDALPIPFYEATKQSRERITSCDLIVDCTGDDSLLFDLAETLFDEPKMFASVSLGFEAKQVFVFCAKAMAFPAEQFKNAINPFLVRERDALAGYVLPRDGIGCWHPAFPARCDDVWMMTAAALKIVEAFIQGDEQMLGLTVLKQRTVDGCFSGIEKVAVS